MRLRAASKSGAALPDLLALAGGLSGPKIIHLLNRPEQPKERIYTRKQNIRLDPEMHDRLCAYALKHGVTVTEAMRTFIEWGLDEEEAA